MDGYNPTYPLNMQQGFPQMNRSNNNTLPSPLQYSGSPQPLRYQNTGSMAVGAQNYPGYNQSTATLAHINNKTNCNKTQQNYINNPSMSTHQNVNMYYQNKFQQPLAQDNPVMQYVFFIFSVLN